MNYHEFRKKIFSFLNELGTEHNVLFVVVGSFAKGNAVFSYDESMENNSDIEFFAYGPRWKSGLIKSRCAAFFQDRIKWSLEWGRKVNFDKPITLYDFDKFTFGVPLGVGDWNPPTSRLAVHHSEHLLLVANRRLEVALAEHEGWDLARPASKLAQALVELGIDEPVEDVDEALAQQIAVPLTEVHRDYLRCRRLVSYFLRCRKIPSLKFGAMAIQVGLLNTYVCQGDVRKFLESNLDEWRKSIGE